VIAIHGMEGAGRHVEVGGAFGVGRAALVQRLSVALNRWDATVTEADGTGSRSHLAGLKRSNLVNRGAMRAGVQVEISWGLRKTIRSDPQAFQAVCGAVDKSLRDPIRGAV
jgi:phage replication-related protein YjqB (UPF0714/DUF867 family)